VPGIAFTYDAGLVDEGRFVGGLAPAELRKRLKPVIARRLDCRDEQGNLIVHQPHQIVFTLFQALPDSGEKLIDMQIFAYDWPDRMRNIDKRMEAIGRRVQKLLKLPEKTVDVSFVKIHRGSEHEAPGWVNV
jgi:hypothetical protein